MILGAVISISVGILCIVFGIISTTGNISLLHSYHRDNVKEEDKKPMGKRVGAGLITVGGSIFTMGIFSILAEALQKENLMYIGEGIMTAGLIVGIIITLVAIKKYNKSIF